MHKFSIKNKVLFVTGAGRKNGIGQALVHEAIKRGAKKIYATARKPSHLQQLKEVFDKRVVPVNLDVTRLDHIQKAASKASDTQVLINNAGVIAVSRCVKGYNERAAREEMEINYFAPLHLMRAFSPHLVANVSGAIVNVVSIGSLVPSPAHVTYSASKAALYSLTQAARREMRTHSLPVFGVYPGPTDTDTTNNITIRKASPCNIAKRIFDGMEAGIMDITTDIISDHFRGYLEHDPNALAALKMELRGLSIR